VRALLNYWAGYYTMSAPLVRALAWVESGWQPHVVSPAGAVGVMQVTPATWEFAQTVLIGHPVPRTTSGNIQVGVVFLRHLYREFHGNIRRALGAYNQGPASVRRHGLFRETRRFVAAVLALKGRV
ncbi:MAG: lytic transglycosylase domain-containing protein, partial [Thermoleophilia bacterium]|nr:lytic transglycosylase domain-containing protein [Thermoleophilia bacterium]